MEKEKKIERELETLILSQVGEVSCSIDAANHVDEVICALHRLAIRLFPVDSSTIASYVDECYRAQVLDAAIPTNEERGELWLGFYHGAGFPAMAKILIYNVASNWLPKFPVSAKKQVYDSFLVQGPSHETIQALVPALARNGAVGESDYKAICSNVERLLILCLLKNEGVRHMVGEFNFMLRNMEHVYEIHKPDKMKTICRVAQLLASIPDKARPDASSALSSHLFFRQVAIQLLVGLEEVVPGVIVASDSNITIQDGSFLFVGETFSRISRRGCADILVVEMIPRILSHVRSCLTTNAGFICSNIFNTTPNSNLWSRLMESVKDQYAIERLCEELLRQLAIENIDDIEAYWILWLLFHQTFKDQKITRVMFIEKFLLWKVLPIYCLRWIIQFAVLECPPFVDTRMEDRKSKGFLDTVRRLVVIWSKSEFVQSTPMEQQAYITAAVGFCLEKMTKEELETTKDVLHLILQGVSCRLESPIHLVRKMASSIALVFSKVVDPKNPLYLDDECSDTVNWDFGIIPKPKRRLGAPDVAEICHDSESASCKKDNIVAEDKRKKGLTSKIAQDAEFKGSRSVDSSKIINRTILSSEGLPSEEDDFESEASEASDDSSLQPYDLSDDDTDLQKKFSQLADISVALRKADDPDGVERALDVAEHLIRALPDELPHISSDLVRALVHVRCSDVTIEGKEDSAEGKRQKALIALLVTCPFESLDVITKLLYSPNVDVSQRILILDVMTEAAEELADTKIIQTKVQKRDLVSNLSDGQPWFIPSSRGPPGVGPWKEVSETRSVLSWSHRYERELPSRPDQTKKGKSRRWALGTKKESQLELTKNKFPLYAAAFMFPAMQGFDKRRHGVDLLNRDFIVLGKLIYMLGVCMKCAAMHPEASALAPALLDMLRSRDVSHHAEAYVRRSVLFAASCILVALHPSYVASALIEGNQEISNGLEWIRKWVLHVTESDPDTECTMMAMRCLQLHAEMALQTSRALESAGSLRSRANALPSKINDIIIPSSSMDNHRSSVGSATRVANIKLF
ncbi:telomere length regulation protein TEL2 homolog [Asparagus officinalis]|uniref:telomere length regulation protein TEL2 homolog n=1 Tax=Asparagus officinalis TaxID=4686 RepID=UPI00098E3971|nr:telomere length regulation protein TEL2 homolog [Asparagus officinalis]